MINTLDSFLLLFFGSLTAAILILALIVFTLLCLSCVFKKADTREILAIVPFYNLYLLFEISGMKGAFFIFLFIPVVGVVFYIMQCIYLCEKFSKSNLFALGLILFPIIFIAILGLGKSEYMNSNRENDCEETY